jgi:hypothetical protein
MGAVMDILDMLRAGHPVQVVIEATGATRYDVVHAGLKAGGQHVRLTDCFEFPTPAPPRPTLAVKTPSEAQMIRAWAAANGINCPSCGRLPRHVVEAYREAS